MCVAPPTHVGAWSMALLLGQPFEYYSYYYKSCENKNYTVMSHTQVNFSAGPWPEIGVLLLELGVGLVSRVSLVSHMVRVRAMLCMLV